MQAVKRAGAVETDTVDELREKTAQVGRDLQELGGVAREAAKVKFESWRHEAAKWEKGFENQIREHPLQAVGIAAGVGFLAGFVIGRR